MQSKILSVSLLRALCICASLAGLVLPATTPLATAQNCASDVNGDGQVDSSDLATLLSSWGECMPEVTDFEPTHGAATGGTLITIHGFNLGNTTEVTVGGAPCTDLEVISLTQLRAVTPPGAVGDATVTVVTTAGTANAATPFDYGGPIILSITPNFAHMSGGTAVTIHGSDLTGTSSVRFGNKKEGAFATDVVVVDDNTVTLVTPAMPGAGAYMVDLSAPKGSAIASGSEAFIFYMVPSWATLIERAPDPAVVTNASLREEIRVSGLPWRVRHTATQIEMLLIPGGTFDMGCSASSSYPCYSPELPVHQVTISRSFYLGRFEVTQAQWQATMGSNPSSFQGPSYPNAPTRPVERVSWNAIQPFLTATGLRLPTEAEWEWSYRAGTTTAFHSSPTYPNGTANDGAYSLISWVLWNSGSQSHVVGGKAANGLGLHDLAGNVSEFTADRYEAYASGAQVDPTGAASGDLRSMRGGSWAVPGAYSRSSFREWFDANSSANRFGFRVAKNPWF